jgi:hypothetical protein
MLNHLEEDNLFLDKIVFSDEATFHLSGKTNHHNLFSNCLGITESTPSCRTCVRQSGGECFPCRTQVYRAFILLRQPIMGHLYLNILEHFLVPQLDVNNVIWQQNGVPPHYHRDVIPKPNIPRKMHRS